VSVDLARLLVGDPADRMARAEDGRVGEDGTAGDYDEFYRSSVRGLCRLAYARTGDWQSAEDLVHDVLGDAYRGWDRIGAYEDPVSWGRRAVLNRTVSRWRSKGREARALRRLGGQRPEEASLAEPTFTDDELWSAIRRLPTRQQQVVLLLWFEELSMGEAAETLECGAETVRTHWRRARSRLASQLGEPDEDDGSPQGAGMSDDLHEGETEVER
jgi:RNA polymerase sigma factor (sigma-70 family)